ncbi:MAG: transposase [Deltaproteobacteria bacterium]|nr:transposase [Deltaproteobacteria bacterium]
MAARGATFFERREGAARAPLASGYLPRRPEKTVLHQVVCEHLATLLSESRQEDGGGLPGFVEREFRRYLTCGSLAQGFVRVRCGRCGEETLVGLSCKRRGFCPSCIGRKMADTAAHLVDRVLPWAPYRQWVVSLPFRLRLRLARSEEFLGAVRRLFMAAVKAWQRRQARALGFKEARTGAVCFTQRFDSLLRTNPHFHAMVPDAVFVEEGEGRVGLVVLPKPRQEDVEWVAARLVRSAQPLLAKLEPEDGPPDALDRLRLAQLDLLPPSPVQEAPPGRLTVRLAGFSLQAATHLHGNDRAGLEALCRYALRPPVPLSRLSQRPDGKLELRLKRPLPGGKTRLTLEPMTLMRRLAGLVPRPRVHQLHYFGVLASHAGLRPSVTPHSSRKASGVCRREPLAQRKLPLVQRPAWSEPRVGELEPLLKAPSPRARTLDWRTLLARTFGDQIHTCRKCGGPLEVVAYVTEPEKAVQLLEELGITPYQPRLARARAPPQQQLFEPSPGFAADPLYPDD